MFHCRKPNNCNNSRYEGGLRVVCKAIKASFENLLDQEHFKIIHDASLHLLVTEIMKYLAITF